MSDKFNQQSANNKDHINMCKANSILEYTFIKEHKNQTPSTLTQSQAAYSNDHLNKTVRINSSKSPFRKSKLSNRSFIETSLNSFSSLYEKEKERRKMKKDKLNRERDLKRINEAKDLQPYPRMNDISRYLVKSKNKSFDSSLYLKQNKIKERQTMNLKQLIHKEMNKNQIDKNKVFSQKKFENFMKNNEEFIRKKKRQTERKTIEIEGELNQFKPEINLKSKQIMEKMRDTSKNTSRSNSYSYTSNETPISRLLFKRKIMKCKQQRKASFTPMINNRTQWRNNTDIITRSNSCNKKPNKNVSGNSNKKNNQINQCKTTLSSPIQVYHSNMYQMKYKQSALFNQRLLKNRKPKTKEIIVDQTDSVSSALYPLNIRSNLSSQEAHSIVTLNRKHKNIIGSYFL